MSDYHFTISRGLVFKKTIFSVFGFASEFFEKNECVPQNAVNKFFLYREQHHLILVILMDVRQWLRIHHCIVYQPKIPSLIFLFWQKTVLWYLRMPWSEVQTSCLKSNLEFDRATLYSFWIILLLPRLIKNNKCKNILLGDIFLTPSVRFFFLRHSEVRAQKMFISILWN